MAKNKTPPPPDYSGIAAAMQQQTAAAQANQQQQMAWAKEQFDKSSAVTDELVKASLDRQAKLDAAGEEDRQRYKAVFQPLEDSLASEAQDYATPARREQRAGAAMADVTNQFNVARTAAQDRLESFGIDPSQVRAGALDISSRVSEAAARAGAGNMSREQTDATARALRSEAINVGRGYPGQVAQAYGLAGQTGQGAASTEFGNIQSGAGTMGSAPQWGSIGTQAAGTWGNLLHTGYSDLLDRYKAQNSTSSGWGSALGLVGGIGLASIGAPATSGLGMIGNKLVKGFGLAGGGRVPAEDDEDDPNDMHAQNDILAAQQVQDEIERRRLQGYLSRTRAWPERHRFYAEGGPVPENMSPSGGVNVDDVPAQGPTGAIQLDGGEFVVPADVVKWKGEEFFQKQIQQSREKRKEAPAQPQVRGAIALASHPAVRSALGLTPGGEGAAGQGPVTSIPSLRGEGDTPADRGMREAILHENRVRFSPRPLQAIPLR
jgi:hypothetical protein